MQGRDEREQTRQWLHVYNGACGSNMALTSVQYYK